MDATPNVFFLFNIFPVCYGSLVKLEVQCDGCDTWLLFQAIFQRYPRPEKEYQSFSLLYNDRSLDLVSVPFPAIFFCTEKPLLVFLLLY